LREGGVNAEQVSPAALVYFIDRDFGGSRIPKKGSMFAHRALPGFL
jgi:hypothetical protein